MNQTKGNTMPFFEAATEPRFTRVNIENPPTDYPRMIEYELNFPQPVDYLVPSNLTGFYTIWYVKLNPNKPGGQSWVVRFQIPEDAIDVNGQAMCYGSFVGVQN
jgi:hypothetical protein